MADNQEKQFDPTAPIEVKSSFSLPYVEGMEQEPGFTGTKENQVLKIFSDQPQKVANFTLANSATLADWLTSLNVTLEQAAADGVHVKAQNKARNTALTALMTKYNLKTITGAGGLGKRLLQDAQTVFTLATTKGGASPEKAYKQVVGFFALKGVELTVEQLQEAGVK